MGKSHHGPVGFMRAHTGFMGADDIFHLVPLTVRIVDIKIYQPGEKPLGHVLKAVMSTMIMDVRGWNFEGERKVHTDSYMRAPKEWILNAGVRDVLKYRFGYDTTDWLGQEIELCVDVCRSVKGGQTHGVRILPSALDSGMTQEQITAHLLSQLRYQPPPPAQVFDGIEGDPEPGPTRRFDDGTGWAE